MIEIEVNRESERLKEAFAEFKPMQVAEALSKSLNAAMLKARKAGADEIKKVYNISDIVHVTSKMKGKNATPGNLTATLYADRLGIQLARFAPAQSTSGKKHMTVEVRRGERQTLRSAFYVHGNKGKGNEIKSLFARGAYKGKKFEFRTKRIVKYPAPDTPIGLLRTTSPLSMLNDAKVKERMENVANDHYEKAVVRQLAKLIRAKG